jgi:hypothetical protein
MRCQLNSNARLARTGMQQRRNATGPNWLIVQDTTRPRLQRPPQLLPPQQQPQLPNLQLLKAQAPRPNQRQVLNSWQS